MTAVTVEPMLLPEEVAPVLRIDARTVRRACAKGEIEGIKVGKNWRIKAQWLARVAGASPGDGEVA